MNRIKKRCIDRAYKYKDVWKEQTKMEMYGQSLQT